ETHNFDGELRRDGQGWQDCTSLALFIDDIERLLRDLYGCCMDDAIQQLRWACLVVLCSITEHVRSDLYQEHKDAQDIDYCNGIGVPEGCGIGGSDYRRMICASHNLADRARAVRAN